MFNTKKIKKFMSIGLISAMLFSVQVMGATVPDIPDTDFKFSFDYTSADVYQYSDTQNKIDTSSCGVTYRTGTYSFTGTIIGATENGTHREFIQVEAVRVYPNSTKVIRNWVYQNYLPKAVLKGEADYDEIYVCEGNWLANGY